MQTKQAGRTSGYCEAAGAIIGPDGKYITEPLYDAPAIVTADLDLRRTSEESMTLDVTGHDHCPELFEFRPLRTGRCPAGEGE